MDSLPRRDRPGPPQRHLQAPADRRPRRVQERHDAHRRRRLPQVPPAGTRLPQTAPNTSRLFVVENDLVTHPTWNWPIRLGIPAGARHRASHSTDFLYRPSRLSSHRRPVRTVTAPRADLTPRIQAGARAEGTPSCRTSPYFCGGLSPLKHEPEPEKKNAKQPLDSPSLRLSLTTVDFPPTRRRS